MEYSKYINTKRLTDPNTFHQEWYKFRPTQLSNSITIDERRMGIDRDDVLDEIDYTIQNVKEEIADYNNSEHFEIIKNALIQQGFVKPSASRKKVIRFFEENAGAVSDPSGLRVLYKGEITDQSKIHDRSHLFRRFVKQVKYDPKHSLDSNSIDLNYWDTDDEIYGRLGLFRFNNKIDPSHTYTLEEVKQMRNNPDIKDEDLFSRYTDEFILHLLNDVAYNENENQQSLRTIDTITLAKNGASLILKFQPGTKLLISHKDYLGIPYKQDGNYNYFEAHPENMPSNSGKHWTSRNPITGKLLKSETHPTFDLMIKGEKEADMDVYRGLNGELYSYPKDKFVPLYLNHFNYGKR